MKGYDARPRAASRHQCCTCETLRSENETLRAELAKALEDSSDWQERAAGLLESLAEWNRAAAAALDGRGEGAA
jgi:hypothetical protein